MMNWSFVRKVSFHFIQMCFLIFSQKNLCFEYSLKKGEEKLSDGAEKLFREFITHAFAKGRKVDAEEGEKMVENVTIVTKKKAEDGTEVLCQEVIQYQGEEKKQKKKEAPLAGAKFVSMKEKLKAQMMERRLEVTT